MISKVTDKIHGVLHDAWHRVYFFWHTREKKKCVAIFVTVLILGVVSALVINGSNALANNRQLNCLALNIYHEARGESNAGQYAVGEVTINRMASKHYPNTLCEVVYQKNWDKKRQRYISAFSWTGLGENADTEYKSWQKAKFIAKQLAQSDYQSKTKGALFYHAHYIDTPYWAKQKREKARIGKHIFY